MRSATLVEDDEGVLREIHVLASCDRPARTVVHEIEVALEHRFGRTIDRRIVSVAQVADQAHATAQLTLDPYPAPADLADRLVLLGFRSVGLRDGRLSVTVRLAWSDRAFHGSADGVEVAQQRLEVFADATLRAVEAAVRGQDSAPEDAAALTLNGVQMLDAFDTPTVLVSVTALDGAGPVALAGAATVEGSRGEAVILATMQATDRWARGHLIAARN